MHYIISGLWISTFELGVLVQGIFYGTELGRREYKVG